MSTIKSRTLLITAGIALLATGLALTLPALRGTARPLPQTGMLHSGTHLIAVVVSASFCVGTGYEGYHEAIPQLQQILGDRAKQAGVHFSTVGVSLDWSVADGLEHLGMLATFDEVSVGRNWVNSNAIRFIWRDLPGEPVVPQLLIVERRVDVTERGIDVGEDRLLTRKVGAREIVDWVDSGAPLRVKGDQDPLSNVDPNWYFAVPAPPTR